MLFDHIEMPTFDHETADGAITGHVVLRSAGTRLSFLVQLGADHSAQDLHTSALKDVLRQLRRLPEFRRRLTPCFAPGLMPDDIAQQIS